ncbi:MAG: zinc ribbon domain-containing protein [Acidobacteria bacterium]|nr:zinc ribbon domain-containing protein [Acidobacteriota bacterium]
MFCPKCGVQNLDDAKFCRACGANIALVPHALAGRLMRRGDSDEDEDEDELVVGDKYTVERGVRKLVSGACFLVAFVVMVLFFREFFWFTFWFIFPAIAKLSSGAGIIAHALHEKHAPRVGGTGTTTALPRASATQSLPDFRLNEVAPADTAEIVAPPASVTEGTTRHLDAVERGAREDSSS